MDLSDPTIPPQFGLSDLYLLEHTPINDLSVAAEDISFDPSPVVRGADADVCAEVHLVGDFVVETVTVEFYDGDPDDTGVLIGMDTIELLLPGEKNTVCVVWSVPDDGQAHGVHVVVDPEGTVVETDPTGTTGPAPACSGRTCGSALRR